MKTYFDKHLFKPIRLNEDPESEVSLIIVIPCFNEPDILSTLNSLQQCNPTNGKVEIVVVINAPENSPSEISIQNEKTFQQIESWKKKYSRFKIFLLRDEDLPSRHAGVGLARKIGMDEAASRFETISRKGGVIICLDADCTVAPNYLEVIEKYFTYHPETKAASIYFEHPLDVSDAALREGIINYELHLRYYRQALKFAGYPFHLHTIGSSMVVRSGVYQQAGGMNRRKAGEDFYFLHKIMPLGNFGEINDTVVYPSARISERVPFGTGRAMKNWVNDQQEFLTYNLQIFKDLKIFIEKIPSLFRVEKSEMLRFPESLPISVSAYLSVNDFFSKVEEINAHTSTLENFVNRFYKWLDGFSVLKFVHYARDNFHPNVPVHQAAIKLLEAKGFGASATDDVLLEVYRKNDQSAFD